MLPPTSTALPPGVATAAGLLPLLTKLLLLLLLPSPAVSMGHRARKATRGTTVISTTHQSRDRLLLALLLLARLPQGLGEDVGEHWAATAAAAAAAARCCCALLLGCCWGRAPGAAAAACAGGGAGRDHCSCSHHWRVGPLLLLGLLLVCAPLSRLVCKGKGCLLCIKVVLSVHLIWLCVQQQKQQRQRHSSMLLATTVHWQSKAACRHPSCSLV
jgi:hypothetical protein